MSNSSPLHRLARAIVTPAFGVILAIAATVTQAATASVAIGFDTDNNSATGCTLTVGGSSMPGVEVALYAVVTTTASTGTVGAVTRRTCAAGVFGAPVTVSAGGWPVGLANGLDGSDLIEAFIPLADLAGAAAVKIGAITSSDSLVASTVLALQALPAAVRVPIPAMSPPGLLFLLLLVGGTGWLLRRYAHRGGRALLVLCVMGATLSAVSALAIILDGNGADWSGVAPLATDPSGDAAAGQDLVALYAVQDGANLALRIDMVLARDPANQQPVANAGVNQTITLPATALLSGSATDDGLPNPPAALTYAWTKVSGPGSVSFGNAASAATSAGFGAAGTYVLRLTASDSVLSASADTTITVNAAGATNQAPIVSAGPNRTITLPAAAALAGTAADDGLPSPPGALTTTWSFVSGPVSGVTFGNPAAPGTTATFQAPGTYTLRLTASDGALSSSSDMQVTVNDGVPLFLSVADRTIALGTRYQQLLVAADANVGDTLTYALLAAPSGAALSPSPLVDWTPTAAQLGLNTFTASVTDAAGHVAQTTFHVTVVHTNQPPQLAPQANVILPVGTTFSRVLQATDPDAGDTLAFALVSGPAGMTLTGAVLNWPTAGKAPGDYPVTVSVTDGGLFDSKQFIVTLTPEVPPPTAMDDSYTVKVGKLLTVAAPGVLANDINPGALVLTASRLTDPGIGTVTAFNGDGSFAYQAPATVPGDPFTVAKLWNAGTGSDRVHELVADLNGDGYPDIVTFDYNAGIRARSGLDGSQLWSYDKTGATDCVTNPGGYGAMEHRVLADLDDSGHPTLAQVTYCTREGSTWHDNILAFDHLGKVKWVSPPLSKPHPDIRRGTTPVPPGGFTPGGVAYSGGLSVARLTAGGPPVLLMNAEIPHNDGYTYYVDAAGVGHYAGCRAVTGLVADENVACRATLIISGTDGSVLQALISRDPAASTVRYGGPNALWQMPPIAMDLDGDGRVDLVSGTDVWMQNLSGGFDLAWHLANAVNDTAVADLDGDGKAEIIHLRSSGEPNADNRGIFIYSYDGQLKRHIPLQAYWFTPLTIADVDGDGRSDIVLGADGTVYAFRDDGQPIWAYKVPPDLPDNLVFAPFYAPPAQSFWVQNVAPQVYDLDGDGVAEVVFAGYGRIMILNGRTGVRKLEPYWTYNWSYNDVSALMLIDMNNDGHVDIVQNSIFQFNCDFSGADFATECLHLIGPTVLRGGSNNWLPGPKAFPNIQYRSTAIDGNARVLHDTKVSRVFRTPEQQGTVRDPRLAQATSFTYAASDGVATSAPATIIIDIVPDNRPPVFTSTPPRSLLEVYGNDGWPAPNFYDAAAYDPDPGDTITFSLKTAPSYVSINSASGRIRFESSCAAGRPTFCDWGWTTVIVTATDSRGASTDQIFIVNLTYQSRTVPNVVGLSFDAATPVLIAQDLQGVRWVEQFSAQPVGIVLAQDAVAGAVVGRFDDIRLTVSKGPQPVLMPFVVGQQIAPVNALLTGAGLTVNVTPVVSTTIPVNQVMAQAPDAGTALLPATAPPVALTVSAGGPLPAPIASIVLEPGPGPLLRLAGDELQYRAVAVLTDGTSADVTLTAAWASSLTGVATVNTVGIARAIASGATTISASRDGKTGQGTLNVASRVLGDNTPPTAIITAPVDGGAVIGPTPIVGTASDTNFLRYELAIALAGDENYTLIAEGTSPVTNGTLGTLDPTMLVNDLYTLRLTVFDRGENESVATRTVQVSGAYKVGLFSLTFQDLGIAMSGLPITVVRTYDSRDKTQGDFGVGWQQGFNTMRLRTNRVPGTGWVRNVANAFVSLAPTAEHKVSLTLPDGRVEEFDMIVSPMSNIGSLDFTNVTGYQPRTGTQGQLQALGNSSLLIVNVGAQVELVDDTTLKTFEPPLYRYTAQDGTQFEIHITNGVKKITDRNGNNVSFGPGGIIHSAGKSVIFTRDMKGRIAQISDPAGNVQTYSYDGNGDLASHVDATGSTTKFFYDRHHGLIRVVDPLGRVMARNDYDVDGRLIATTDAAGNQITYTHNIGALTELVRDRLGNPTLYAYDAMGNLIAKTDPLGHVTTYTFDSRNNLLTHTDPLGRTTVSTYDADNNLISQTDPMGNATHFTYDSRGLMLTITDPLGRTSTNTYDASGNVLTQTDPLGNTTSVSYDPSGSPLAVTDPLGNTSTNEYSFAGNRTKLIQPGGNALTFSYDTNGNLLSQANALSPAWALSYNAANRLTSTVVGNVTRSIAYDAAGQTTGVAAANGQEIKLAYDPLGHLAHLIRSDDTTAILRTYDAEGNALTETDATGNVTSHAYDAARRRIATTFPDGSTEHRVYDAAGQLVQLTDRLGQSTAIQYDAAGRQTQTVDALGGVTSRAYDAAGNIVALTDALGHTTHFAFDLANRLILTTFPDNSTEQRSYDSAGRMVLSVDPAGHSTTWTYDAPGRLVAVTDSLGHTTQYEYDTAGKRTAIVDANGNRTDFAYDSQGRLISTTRPLGDSDSTVYDFLGRPVATTNGNGATLLYNYDARGQLSSLVLPNGTTETYSYNPDGSLDSVVDARGTTRFQYDSVTSHLTRVIEPDGRYVRYAYNVAGSRTLMAHAMSAGGPEEISLYAYDARNRLVQVTDPGGGITRYTYDAVGNQTAINRPNSTTTAFAYDTRNRLTAEVHKDGNGITLASFTYILDAAGNRTKVQHHDGSRIEYDYDATYKMIAERHFDASNALTRSVAYGYDAAGNLVSRPGAPGNPTYTYNANNQLTAGDGFSYVYDGNGNLVSKTSGADAITRYSYDEQGRLTQFQPPLGGATTYSYDFKGLRQSKSGPGGTVNFLTDRASATGFPQVVRESNAAGTTLRSYNFGTGLLARTEGGSVLYYHGDGLGSTRLLTDSTGAPADTYAYSAYGQLLAGGASANAYQFAGEQQDAESGLYYLRARYYDPATGRFLSRDPAAGNSQVPLSMHKYLYANGNPTNRTDPSGLYTAAEMAVVLDDIGMWLSQRVPKVIKAKQGADRTIGQTLRATAAILSLSALAEAYWSPFNSAAWYGPWPARLLGEVALFGIVVDSFWRQEDTYETRFFGPSEAGLKAFVKMEDQLPYYHGSPPVPDQHMWMYFHVPYFFLSTPLPTPMALLGTGSMPGMYIHEFAHVTYRLYDLPGKLGSCVLAFTAALAANLPIDPGSGMGLAAETLGSAVALFSPENHRCFVEAGWVGVPIEMLKSKLLGP